MLLRLLFCSAPIHGALCLGTFAVAASSPAEVGSSASVADVLAQAVEEPANTEAAEPVEDIEPQPSFVPASRVEAELPLTLVATMEAESPATSFVTISHANGVTGVYAEGDEVMPGVQVHAIGTGVVVLRTDEGLQVLQLGADEAPGQVRE